MDKQDLENRFTFHPATGDQPLQYQDIRDRARGMADVLNRLCPDGRELSSAITHLEEVVFWANASIARAAQ